MSQLRVFTISEAAALLDVSRQRIHQLIVQGRMSAQKIGCYWIIDDLTIKSMPEKSKEAEELESSDDSDDSDE